MLETLVSMSLLLIMVGAVALCERSIRRAQPQAAIRSQVDRAALVAFERIRSELRGAHVLGPTDPAALSFYAPDRLEDGQVKVGSTGEPVYESQPRTLQATAGRVTVGDRVLANLGPTGWLRFELEGALLEVTVYAADADSQTVRELRGTLPVPNQN